MCVPWGPSTRPSANKDGVPPFPYRFSLSHSCSAWDPGTCESRCPRVALGLRGQAWPFATKHGVSRGPLGSSRLDFVELLGGAGRSTSSSDLGSLHHRFFKYFLGPFLFLLGFSGCLRGVLSLEAPEVPFTENTFSFCWLDGAVSSALASVPIRAGARSGLMLNPLRVNLFHGHRGRPPPAHGSGSPKARTTFLCDERVFHYGVCTAFLVPLWHTKYATAHATGCGETEDCARPTSSGRPLRGSGPRPGGRVSASAWPGG